MFSVYASKEIIDFTPINNNHLNSIELTPVSENELPHPYQFLLTQPLMTVGLEKFYHYTSTVQVLQSQKHTTESTYSRVVIMNILVNDELKKEARKIPVELAYITINLKQLPKALINNVFQSTTPFGKLVLQYNIKVYSREFKFYSTNCTEQLAQLIACPLNKTIYARKNFLYRKDNNEWIANVLEILPGHEVIE